MSLRTREIKKELPKEAPKQGYKDSNLEMTESESVALPFGDSPMSDDKGDYNGRI